MHVVDLEVRLLPVAVAYYLHMSFQQHAQCVPVGSLGDTLVVAAVVVESSVGRFYDVGILQEPGEGVGIFKEASLWESHLQEERGAIDFVAGIAVTEGILIPVFLHVVIASLSWKRPFVLAVRAVVLIDGILQYVRVCLSGQHLHQRAVGVGC